MNNINYKVFEHIGLSEKEARVLVALTELGSAKLTILSKRIVMPRTSLYPIIKHISDRGLIYEKRVGNHKEWSAVEPKELHKIGKDALKNLEEIIPELEKLKEYLPISKEKSEIVYYKSEAGVKKAIQEMIKLRKGERVYGVEGLKSIELEKWIGKTSSRECVKKWQNNLKKSEIIYEGIMAEETLRLFEKMDKEMLSHHANRLVIATILPDNLMDFKASIYAFQDTLLIVSYQQNLAIFINNPEVTKAFKILFKIVSQTGRKIDLNSYIQDLLLKLS